MRPIRNVEKRKAKKQGRRGASNERLRIEYKQISDAHKKEKERGKKSKRQENDKKMRKETRKRKGKDIH